MTQCHSFLWLSNIPLNIYICMYVYIYTNTHTHTHIFFIHSSVDGHLGCFHVLAIVNSAAVSTGMDISFQLDSWWLSSRELACQCRRRTFDPWVGKIPCHWRRRWQATPVFLPGKSHGQRSLAGCSPWGHRVRQDSVTIYNNSSNLSSHRF